MKFPEGLENTPFMPKQTTRTHVPQKVFHIFDSGFDTYADVGIPKYTILGILQWIFELLAKYESQLSSLFCPFCLVLLSESQKALGCKICTS